MDNPLTAEEREMAERCEKATPGPWCWESVAEKSNEFIVGVGCDELGNFFSGQVPKDEWVEDAVIERRTFIGSDESGSASFSDASFIAHARTDIPALLATVAALRAELAQVKAERPAFDIKHFNVDANRLWNDYMITRNRWPHQYMDKERFTMAIDEAAKPLIREIEQILRDDELVQNHTNEMVEKYENDLAQVKAEREARWIAAKVEALREAAQIIERLPPDTSDQEVYGLRAMAAIRSRADELEKPAPPSENGAGLEDES